MVLSKLISKRVETYLAISKESILTLPTTQAVPIKTFNSNKWSIFLTDSVFVIIKCAPRVVSLSWSNNLVGSSATGTKPGSQRTTVPCTRHFLALELCTVSCSATLHPFLCDIIIPLKYALGNGLSRLIQTEP